MLYRSTAIATALAGGLTAAQAADVVDVIEVPEIAPAPVVSFGWTGPYVGASLGYGFADTQVTALPLVTPFVTRGFDEFPPVIGPEPEAEGAASSLHAGFDYAFGALVVGAELEGGYLALEDEAQVLVPGPLRTLDRADDDTVSIEFGLYGTAT
jgi:opacity protein-like surface antigen